MEKNRALLTITLAGIAVVTGIAVQIRDLIEAENYTGMISLGAIVVGVAVFAWVKK